MTTTITDEVRAALYDSEPVNTLGSRMGEMFDYERVARLVRADCARRPFALVLIGDGGVFVMVRMFATEEARTAALPILRERVNRGFAPMDSMQAMLQSSSFYREALGQ